MNAGPQHSQSLGAWFAQVPGLKVVAPSTPRDVLGLFKSAIRDDNPVLCLFAKRLIGSSGEVPEESENFTLPIGRAEVRRETYITRAKNGQRTGETILTRF